MLFRSVVYSFIATIFMKRSHSQRRDLFPRERRRDKKPHAGREREIAKEREQNVTREWKRARSHSTSWILAAIHMRVCVYMYVRTLRFQDALSNVLFISVEQSLPVYPEDISLVALCTQRYGASQSRELHLKRRLSAVASRPRRSRVVSVKSLYAYH